MDDAAKGLFVDYLGCEWTPDQVTQYASFSVRLNGEGFSGSTEFDATGQHVGSFVQQLISFIKKEP